MLKLNASYSKKIPAEQDYSSKSFHASIETELPDGLSEEQLKAKIHDTFQLVKESVEAEINGKPETNTQAPLPENQPVREIGRASGRERV